MTNSFPVFLKEGLRSALNRWPIRTFWITWVFIFRKMICCLQFTEVSLAIRIRTDYKSARISVCRCFHHGKGQWSSKYCNMLPILVFDSIRMSQFLLSKTGQSHQWAFLLREGSLSGWKLGWGAHLHRGGRQSRHNHLHWGFRQGCCLKTENPKIIMSSLKESK